MSPRRRAPRLPKAPGFSPPTGIQLASLSTKRLSRTLRWVVILALGLPLLPGYAAPRGTARTRAQQIGMLLDRAQRLQEDGQFGVALSYNERALALAEKRRAADPGTVGLVLDRLADLYVSWGDRDRAEGVLRRALDLRRRTLGSRHAAVARAMDALGTLLVDEGRGDEAIALYTRALDIQRSLGDGRGEADSLHGLAEAYNSLGRYDKAAGYYQKALDRYRALKDRRGEGITLKDYGSAYTAMGQYDRAVSLYEAALKIQRAMKDRGDEGNTLNNLGSTYNYQLRYGKAISYYEGAAAAYRDAGDLPGEVQALKSLGSSYVGLGQSEKAIEYFEKALIVQRGLRSRATEAEILDGLGDAHEELGQHDRAIAYYGRALQLHRSLTDRSGEADSLTGLGHACASLNGENQALRYYEQALTIRKEIRDRKGEAVVLNDLGAAYYHQGAYSQATDFYNRSLAARRDASDRSGEGETLDNLGAVYRILGEYDKAIDCFTQALAIYQESGNGQGQTDCLNWLGVVFYDLGRYSEAERHFRKARVLQSQMGDRKGEARSLNGLGSVLYKQRQYASAIEAYQQALAIEHDLNDREDEGTTLNNLGAVYSFMRQYNKSIQTLESALATARQNKDRPTEGSILSNLGEACAGDNRYQDALGYDEQSLMIQRERQDRQGEGIVLHNLMDAWKALQKPRLAIFYGKQAVNIYQRIRANLGPVGPFINQVLDKQTRQTFLHSNEDTYRELAELLIAEGRLPEAQQVLDLLKEEEYFEFLRRDGSAASSLSGRADLTPSEDDWQKRYQEIGDRVAAIGRERQELIAKGQLTDAEQKRLDQLNADMLVVGKAFKGFLDSLANQFDTPQEASDRIHEIKDAQNLMGVLRVLGPGTVILYTIVGKDKYSVILMTADARKPAEYPIVSAELNKRVLEFRDALQHPWKDPRPSGEDLYKILVGPVQKELDAIGAQTLMWSLDGVLRYVPVAALYDGQKYLVERYRNVVFTPASQANLKDEPQPQWKALGFGVSKAQPGFNPLPAVPEELHEIIRDDASHDAPAGASRDLSPGTPVGVLPGRIMLDQAFTQNALFAALQQPYPVVHIASHFQFQPGSDDNSFLLLGDGKHLSLAQIDEQTNIFDGVDLLTLSACNTATGDTGADGKEVEGFGVLAQRQGAKAVVATLWPVADESTQLMMRQFYQLCDAQPRQSKAEALQGAQLALLHGTLKGGEGTGSSRSQVERVAGSEPPAAGRTYTPDPNAPFAHPYFWAPFIMIGNWR